MGHESEEESVQKIHVKCGRSGAVDFRRALMDLLTSLQEESPREKPPIEKVTLESKLKQLRKGMPSRTKTNAPLTKTLQRMYDMLADGRSIPADALLSATTCAKHISNPREKRQTLGPYITKLNRRLLDRSPPQQVQSGTWGHSYRLVTLDPDEV